MVNSNTYLIDTCIALYFWKSPEMLSSSVIDLITNTNTNTNNDTNTNTNTNTNNDTNNDILFHQASKLEICLKYGKSKLSLQEPMKRFIDKAIDEDGFTAIAFQDKEIYMLHKLERIHQNPFDRILVACAIIRGIPILTLDQTIQKYPVICIS